MAKTKKIIITHIVEMEAEVDPETYQDLKRSAQEDGLDVADFFHFQDGIVFRKDEYKVRLDRSGSKRKPAQTKRGPSDRAVAVALRQLKREMESPQFAEAVHGTAPTRSKAAAQADLEGVSNG